MKKRILSEGSSQFFEARTSSSFNIDREGLALFSQHEMPRLLKDRTGTEVSLFKYLRLGFISLAHGAHASYDRMIRIGRQLERYNIDSHDYSDPVALIHKIADAQPLSLEQMDAINAQLSRSDFVRYYQDHYYRAVTLLDGSQASAYPIRNKEFQLDLAIH